MGTFFGNDQINCYNLKTPIISLMPGITIAILFQTQREHTTSQRSDVKCVPDLKIEPICPKSWPFRVSPLFLREDVSHEDVVTVCEDASHLLSHHGWNHIWFWKLFTNKVRFPNNIVQPNRCHGCLSVFSMSRHHMVINTSGPCFRTC